MSCSGCKEIAVLSAKSDLLQTNRINKLKAENAKLREALEEIAVMGDDGYPVSDCRNIARAALEADDA